MRIFKHIVWIALALAALMTPSLPAQEKDKVYTVSDGIVLPKVKHRVEPDYTEKTEVAGIMGEVTPSLEVDKGGKSRNVKVVKGLDAGLDQNAIRAVNEWTWEPAAKDGQPVVCTVKIAISFKVQ